MRHLTFLTFVPAFFLLLLCRVLRQRGVYSRQLFGLCHAACQLCPHPGFLWFRELLRRDLGFRCQRSTLIKIRPWISRASARDRGIFEGLNCESRGAEATAQSANVNNLLRAAAARREAELRHHLSAIKHLDLFVVGNSAKLAEQNLGPVIDDSGFVVRFNRWDEKGGSVGRRCDLWIRSAESMPVPQCSPRWQLLSGPAMLSRIQDPALQEQLLCGPFLDFPLIVWRTLVKKLDAPPSAGLCALWWLRGILGDWAPLQACGFGFDAKKYHVCGAQHRPSLRHHWRGEAALLKQWQAEGLNLL